MARFHFVDADSKNQDPFGSQAEGESDFEKLLNASATISNRRFKAGESVQGPIIRIGADFIFVDLGGKATGAMALEEWEAGSGLPKEGDILNAYVREDNGSEIVLTKSLKKGEADAAALLAAYQSQVPVQAKIEKVVKGGFEASISGKRAFVPLGHVSSKRIENPESFLGVVLPFHISEFKQGGRNIVLSRKALLQEEEKQQVNQVLEQISEGARVFGTVSRIVPFGVFVDLGGVEGLLPMAELSWKRVAKAEDVVQLGEKVLVKVLKIEKEPKLRIGLSLKDAGEDPWTLWGSRLQPGQKISGKCTRLADFGAFFEIEGGLEGLCHISQMSWEKRIAHPKDVVEPGALCELTILTVDPTGRKLSLSLKGPISESLLQKSKLQGQALTDVEKAQMQEWESYQKTVKPSGPSQTATSGVLASAFERAKKRS